MGAGLSIISAVPYLGDAIGKPVKASRMARKATKLASKLKHKTAQLAKKLDNLRKGKKPKPWGGGGTSGKWPDGGHIPKGDDYVDGYRAVSKAVINGVRLG